MDTLYKMLLERGLTLSTSESLTGGLFGALLTGVSGVSQVYKGGVIVYCNEAKKKVLSIEKVDEYKAISANTAIEMAQNVCPLFQSDIGISFTGNAGPTSVDDMPVGRVYSAICYKGETWAFEDDFSGSRDEIRMQSIVKMVGRIIEKIK